MATTLAKYRCDVCEYVYDPEEGDWRSGTTPGTPFEKLPDTWRCPVCSMLKENFVKVE